MAAKPSQNPNTPLYPEVDSSNPDANSPVFTATSSPVDPSVDIPISSSEDPSHPLAATDSIEEVLITTRGSMIHLIDKNQSIELAYGNLEIIRIRQNDTGVAVLARIGDKIQWPLAKDEAVVKLDDSHYFFTMRVPGETPDSDSSMLNYGVTIAAKGQEDVLGEFDRILGRYSNFSTQEVAGEVEGWWMAQETAPSEMERDERKREMVEENSAAYWTTIAPNVEDYSGSVARLIAAGSGKLIQGILWCGDVTVDRLKWGNDYLRKRMGKKGYSDVSPEAIKRIESVKKMTMMSEQVATGFLSGVVRVTGCVAGSIANSKLGQKFFTMLPGEIILASLDGYNKICDAIEVAGKNVMSTTSEVTTELVLERYGDQAAKATNVGLDAAGHVIGTAWAVFKITRALNPKSAIKPSRFVKAAAAAAAQPKSKKQS